MRTTRLAVLQHVPHERLGTFEEGFTQAGCALVSVDAYDPRAVWPALGALQGLVVMGGPMGVSQQTQFPFLTRELRLLERALHAGLPILGVCLGAQLLAHALGASVTRAPRTELGWHPLRRREDAADDPLCGAFRETETVFQWHSDTYALPAEAVRLAGSPLCAQQAFRWGPRAWGLQFHVEMTAALIRAWLRLPANQGALRRLRGTVDPLAIRRATPRHIGRLQELSRHVAGAFAACAAGG